MEHRIALIVSSNVGLSDRAERLHDAARADNLPRQSHRAQICNQEGQKGRTMRVVRGLLIGIVLSSGLWVGIVVFVRSFL